MRTLTNIEVVKVNGGITPIIEAVALGVGVYYGGSKISEATSEYARRGEQFGNWAYDVTHPNQLGQMHYDASDFSSIPSFPNR